MGEVEAAASRTANTRLQCASRPELLGYRHYADDVVEGFVAKSAENGIDVFRVFDALNDLRNIETVMKAVKRCDKHAQGTICYTTSPAHTSELLWNRYAAGIDGCRFHCD